MIDAEFKQIFNLPFSEAESFFKQKLNIPTEHWADLWQGEHAKGFMSAGAYHADLLTDLRAMVDKAIAGGVSKKDFRDQFRPLVEKHGWQLQGGGPAWRSDLIWQTNRATAFSAGRWQQLESAGIKYLRYVHADGIMHPRPHHLAMHGIVRPRTDAFWSVNYPPNGFRCHCRAEPVSDKEYAVTPQNLKGLPADWQTAPDVGWRYNVGEQYLTKNHEILADKIITLEAQGVFGKEVAAQLRRQIEAATGLFPSVKPVSEIASKLLSADMLLPAYQASGWSEEQYVRLFLQEFGGDLGSPVTFQDVTGVPVVISEELFRDRQSGSLKVFKSDREVYLKVLADTIKDPAEIWLTPLLSDEKKRLCRRYVGLYSNDKQKIGGFVVFDMIDGEWQGTTAFKPRSLGNLEKQRVGELLYTKK